MAFFHHEFGKVSYPIWISVSVFCVINNSNIDIHSVWKSPKKSHLTLRAKRAMFTFWVDKSYLKKPKNGQFWRILKTWRFWSNSITRPVILGDFQTLWVRLSWVTFLSFEKKSLSFFWKNSGKNSESRT